VRLSAVPSVSSPLGIGTQALISEIYSVSSCQTGTWAQALTILFASSFSYFFSHIKFTWGAYPSAKFVFLQSSSLDSDQPVNSCPYPQSDHPIPTSVRPSVNLRHSIVDSIANSFAFRSTNPFSAAAAAGTVSLSFHPSAEYADSANPVVASVISTQGRNLVTSNTIPMAIGVSLAIFLSLLAALLVFLFLKRRTPEEEEEDEEANPEINSIGIDTETLAEYEAFIEWENPLRPETAEGSLEYLENADLFSTDIAEPVIFPRQIQE
jgi:hypothetical protein